MLLRSPVAKLYQYLNPPCSENCSHGSSTGALENECVSQDEKTPSKCILAPAQQMPLPFFRDFPQKVVVCGVAILRHLRHAVEVERVAVLVLVDFPIFGQRRLRRNKAGGRREGEERRRCCTCNDILASGSRKPSVKRLIPRYSAMSCTSWGTAFARGGMQKQERAKHLRRDGCAQALRWNAKVLGDFLHLKSDVTLPMRLTRK